VKGRLLRQVLSLYNKSCTYQLCKRQSADTVIMISRYQLSAIRPIPIIGGIFNNMSAVYGLRKKNTDGHTGTHSVIFFNQPSFCTSRGSVEFQKTSFGDNGGRSLQAMHRSSHPTMSEKEYTEKAVQTKQLFSVKFTIKSVEVTCIAGIAKVFSATKQGNCDSHCCPDVVRHDCFLSRQRTATVSL